MNVFWLNLGLMMVLLSLLVENIEISQLCLLVNKFSDDRNIEQNSQLIHVCRLHLYLTNTLMKLKSLLNFFEKNLDLSLKLLQYCTLTKVTIDTMK